MDQNFSDQIFWTQHFFLTENFFRPKFFLTKKDLVWFYGINLPNQNCLNQRLTKLNTLDLSLVLYEYWCLQCLPSSFTFFLVGPMAGDWLFSPQSFPHMSGRWRVVVVLAATSGGWVSGIITTGQQPLWSPFTCPNGK